MDAIHSRLKKQPELNWQEAFEMADEPKLELITHDIVILNDK